MTNESAKISQESIELRNDSSYEEAYAEHLARAASECPFGTGRARSLQAASVTVTDSQNDHSYDPEVIVAVIVVAIFFVIFYVLGVPFTTLYCMLTGGYTFFCIGLRDMHSKGKFFIAERRPFQVGDLIELDPCEASISLDEEYTWRVESFDLYRTELVALGNHVRNSIPNESLATRRITNWSRLPVSFQILLKVPVDTRNALELLENYHEEMKRYASDNPSEWFAVDTSTDDAITVGNEYVSYLVEIRHRESWQHYELVLRSKSRLIGYCVEKIRNLNLKKPAKRFTSAPPKAVGDASKGSGDNNADNEEDDKRNQTEKKKEHREEDRDKKKEIGEAENGNDDDRRIDFRIFVG